MKFEQKLDANKHSDWPYIDYKGLKKVMKKVIKGFLNTSSKSGSQPASVAASPSAKRAGSAMDALRAPLLPSPLRQLEPTPEGAVSESRDQSPLPRWPLRPSPTEVKPSDEFLGALREQRDVVQNFYTAELQRHREQIQLLIGQFGSPSPGMSTKQAKQQEQGRRTEASLQRASTDAYRTLQHLRNYAILNYTGLLKMAKKFDKKFHEDIEESRARAVAKGLVASPPPRPTSPLYTEWTAEVEACPFVTPDELDELCSQLEKAFADSFCDGSIQAARATLLVRKIRPNTALLLSFGLRLGLAVGLAFWIAWDELVDVKMMHLGNMRHTGMNTWLTTQLPLLRAGGAVVVVQFLWALCLHLWSKSRINFEFMLDLDPKTNTSALIAASTATRTCVFYLLSLLLFTKSLIGELPRAITPGVFPVAILALTFGSIVLQHGRALTIAMATFLLAPLHPVTFSAVLVGDMLTSMVKPMQVCSAAYARRPA